MIYKKLVIIKDVNDLLPKEREYYDKLKNKRMNYRVIY